MRSSKTQTRFVAASVICISVPALAQNPPVPEYLSLTSDEAIAGCDRYAAHPDDPMKPANVPGVANDADVAHDAAYVYCMRAFGLNQDNPRLAFQNGRVSHARAPNTSGQPLQMFKIAYRSGSQIAGAYIRRLFPAEARRMFTQGGQTPPSGGATTQRSRTRQGSTLASFIDGLGRKTNQIEVTFNGLAERTGCCGDTIRHVTKKFPEIRGKISALKSRWETRGRWSCDRMEFLKYDIEFLGTWMQVLAMEAQEERYRGSIAAQDRDRLDSLRNKVRQTATSIQTQAERAGCANFRS